MQLKKMTKEIRFITSVFGNRHVNMLMPLLYSISKTNPSLKASIFWEDINNEKIELIKKVFPKFDFIQTHFNFTNDLCKRISSKTIVLEYASDIIRDQNEYLLFLDTDTLVVKDLNNFIDNLGEFDVIFTNENGKFPINSGVMLCKNSKKIHIFFKLWKEETIKILNEKKLFDQANDKNLPYGGSDQMSLHKILGYTTDQNNYEIKINDENILFKGVSCRILNETTSRKLNDNLFIIHYKGGWRSILFEGGNFTTNRSKKDSWEMYIFYLRTFFESVIEMNHRLNTSFAPKDFNLVVPFYLNTRTWKEYSLLYPFYFIFSYIKFFPKRFQNFYREALINKIE